MGRVVRGQPLVCRAERSPEMLRVGGKRDHTFGSTEVQHIPVFPEHVNLLHAGDWLDVELLQSTL